MPDHFVPILISNGRTTNYGLLHSDGDRYSEYRYPEQVTNALRLGQHRWNLMRDKSPLWTITPLTRIN